MNPQDISSSLRMARKADSPTPSSYKTDPGRFRLVTIMSRRLALAERRILQQATAK